MKQTPEEKTLYRNFLPGEITRDGFLGSDTRHIHDIVAADENQMQILQISIERLTDKMQGLIEAGKEGLEQEVSVPPCFSVSVHWVRGMLPCPFGDRGLHHKLICRVTNRDTGSAIRYSQLSVHMIAVHHFFGGRGSSFRLEPAELARILEI